MQVFKMHISNRHLPVWEPYHTLSLPNWTIIIVIIIIQVVSKVLDDGNRQFVAIDSGRPFNHRRNSR